MAYSKINTYYKYFGIDKPYDIIINNDFADSIRNGTWLSVTFNNINSASEFFARIYDWGMVGDISDFCYPLASFMETSYPDIYSHIESIFQNTYSVEGISGFTSLNNYFEFDEVLADGHSQVSNGSSSKQSTVAILRKGGEYTPLTCYFTANYTLNSQKLSISLQIPILKSNDFVDGKIKEFSAGEYLSYININYNESAKTIVITPYRTAISSNATSRANQNVFANITPPTPPEPPAPDDPYAPSGGYSTTGGGPNPDGTGTTGTGGLHDDTSDPIPTPSLPSNVAIGSGLFTAYNPSGTDLANFANALWGIQSSDIDDVLRFLFGGDAFNAIIGLHLLPVAPSTSGSPNIKLGNWDSGVSAPKIVSQYVQVPFGSVLLPEYWGNCIDYAPYTKIQLALPYIGIVDVDTDDVLGSTNTLTYNIDVLSGAICATLKCEKFNLNSVIYQWSGSCAVSLPITGSSFNAVLGAVAGIGAAAAGTFALASGPIGAAIGAVGSTIAGTGMLAGAAANAFGSVKGKVQKSGAFGANSGALGIMTPYFILTRPVQSVPSSWQADKGYPANISAQLNAVTGYTEVSEINLECSGTEAEKEEIIKLLKSGVIF